MDGEVVVLGVVVEGGYVVDDGIVVTGGIVMGPGPVVYGIVDDGGIVGVGGVVGGIVVHGGVVPSLLAGVNRARAKPTDFPVAVLKFPFAVSRDFSGRAMMGLSPTNIPWVLPFGRVIPSLIVAEWKFFSSMALVRTQALNANFPSENL